MAHHIVEQALIDLAGVCDGAHMKDHQGFNGFDARLGRSFADQLSQGRRLSPKQREVVGKMLPKYRRQIADWEQVQEALPEWVAAQVTVTEKKKSEPLPHLDHRDGKFYLKTEFKDREFAKALAPARWIAEEKQWRYIDNLETRQGITSNLPLIKSVSPAARKVLDAHQEGTQSRELQVERVADIKLAEDIEVDVPLNADLYDHQKKAFKIGIELDAAGFLMEQGTGKTLAAIAVAGHRFLEGQIKRLVIVAPKSVLGVWEKEFRTFAAFPHRVCILPKQSAKKAQLLADWEDTDGLQVIIINYEATWRVMDELKVWGPQMIIADESQRIKNIRTNQSKALSHLGKDIPFRLILTGTPVTQSPLDFFSQYKFLDSTVFGAKYSKFRDRYATAGGYGGYQIIGYKNLEELAEKAHSIAYRVTKAEALDLPETVDQTLYAELEPAALAVYKQMERKALVTIGDSKASAPIVLTQMLRLSQISGGFLKVMADPEGGDLTAAWSLDGILNTLGADKDLTGDQETFLGVVQKAPEGQVVNVSTAKLDTLKETVDDLVLEAGKKVVIFARFIPEIDAISDILTKLGIKHHTLTGKTNNRDEIIEDFQTNPDTKVFVSQIATGGLGITLTAADTAIFYSLDFSLTNYEQARARVHRIGQDKKVTYIHIVAKDTIDEEVVHRLSSKQDIAKMVVDDLKNLLLRNRAEKKAQALTHSLSPADGYNEDRKTVTDDQKEEPIMAKAKTTKKQDKVEAAVEEVAKEVKASKGKAPKSSTRKAAPKAKAPKAEKAPKTKKAAATDEDVVTLKQLASELDMDGRVARRKLREAGIEKPGGRWEWAAGSKALTKVTKALSTE